MHKRRWMIVVLFAVVALLGASACGDDNEQEGTGAATTAAGAEKLEPGKFAAGTTMAAIQQKGKIVVGVKKDQPGFGQLNPTNGETEGFDVEIAELVAKRIFGENIEGKVELKEAVSKNREPFIQNGEVDIVVATYTINDERKKVVDFAGPYFVAEQDIMVLADDTTIESVEDLNGKKVCSVQGSTSAKNVVAKAPQVQLTLLTTYTQCADELTNKRVVAVTTDNTILAGLVSTSDGRFKLVEEPFSEEPYGIGLKKGDDTFRTFLNDTLEDIYESGEWEEAFEATLGKIGLKTPEPPDVDRYTSAGGSGATTTTGAAGGAATTARP